MITWMYILPGVTGFVDRQGRVFTPAAMHRAAAEVNTCPGVGRKWFRAPVGHPTCLLLLLERRRRDMGVNEIV